MTTFALYEIADRHRALLQLVDGDELPPEVIRDTLESLDGELRDKAMSVAHFIRNIEFQAEGIEEAAAAMMARADVLQRRAASLRDYLLFHLQATNTGPIISPQLRLTVRDNPPAVMIDDESKLPADCKVFPQPPPPRPDRIRIAQKLKAGEDVPGCRLVVRQRLEIKA